jgi:hypothetical protein
VIVAAAEVAAAKVGELAPVIATAAEVAAAEVGPGIGPGGRYCGGEHRPACGDLATAVSRWARDRQRWAA